MYSNVGYSGLNDTKCEAWQDTSMSYPLPISEDEKNCFLSDGYIRLDNVISEDELDWYRERYDDAFGDESEIKHLGGKDEQGRASLPQILQPHRKIPGLLERPYFKRIEGIARFILGSEASFKTDHMILKPAGHGVATPWHQDQAYHKPEYAYANINFWLPLEGATVEGGSMQYVRGTHRGTVMPHRYLIAGDRQSAMVADHQDYWSMNGEALDCPVGSVLLHHSYCMHYAGPNLTQLPRRAFIAVFAMPPQPLKRPLNLPWQADPFWPGEE